MFEKKIRSLCHEVQDKTLGKYFLDNFTQKIEELTPNLNLRKNRFFGHKKMQNPLQKTKEIFIQKNKFEEKELKEFSILFLIMNNLNIFKKNIELVSEIDFSDDTKQELKQSIINYLLSEKSENKKTLKSDDLSDKFKSVINQINTQAPIKIIMKEKNEEEIIMMFNEIIEEIKKIDLSKRIETLEHQVSVNLDEKLYSELLFLRNQLKSG